MFDIENLLKKLNIDEDKIENIMKKDQLKNNLEILYTQYDTDNKLLYTLACTAPKNINLLLVGKLIVENYIKNESTLRAIYKKLSKNDKKSSKNSKADYEDLKKYIKENEKTEEDVLNIIREVCESGLTRKEALIKLKNMLPFEDSKFVMDEVNKFEFDQTSNSKKLKDWLEEGEISKLHKPGENPQLTEEIRADHLKRTGGKVVTRFPPEPNGILHIGHAKAINLDFGYAEKYKGICYLRFDDTNPRNEEDFYFDSIIEDVKWLGFTPIEITSSSKYFDEMIKFAEKLIKKDKAYICDLSNDEIKKRRRLLSEAFETTANDSDNNDKFGLILSPFRNRSIDENLEIFRGMVSKKFKEGDHTLRFKMDLSSRNPLMFDLVGMRIVDSDHVKTKDKYNLYPSYEFALCVSDSLEDVTHSFCTREFFTRQESYNWLLDELEIYKPVQWEFSRLNISNTILSKRKIVPLEKYGIKLDDPRLYTIKGMRRRGIPPEAINNFVKSLGLTYSETIIDNKIFESFIRDELNKTARRIMCVMDPLKIYIRNTEEHFIKVNETEKIKFTPEIYIEKSDFKMETEEDFLRFTPSQPVGLYLFGTIKFISIKDNVIIAEITDETPKKYIHWVSSDSQKVELRIYDQLFKSYNPEEGNYLENINYDSLKIVEGYCDRRISGCKDEEKFQFQRIGYFCVDKDSTSEKVILNKTISLK